MAVPPSHTPIDLVGISGSLRRGSLNTGLLRAARSLLPSGVSLEILPVGGIPIYDADVERSVGFPGTVAALRERVARADGLLFASPEYNWSVTGALKNVIDWLSRPPNPPIDRKPAAIMGVGGGSGTARSQSHLRDILGHNGLLVVAEPQVLLRSAEVRFVDGEPVDAAVRSTIARLVAALVEVVERVREVPPPPVRGSVLVVGRHRASLQRLTRELVELGYRVLVALDEEEARVALETRTVAAVILGPGLTETERNAMREGGPAGRPALPIIDPPDPRRAAILVAGALGQDHESR